MPRPAPRSPACVSAPDKRSDNSILTPGLRTFGGRFYFHLFFILHLASGAAANFLLTCKQSLTYIASMVATPDLEPDVFNAIGHRARRQVLDLLTQQERTVTDIAAHFEMSRPAVSQHLRI